MKVIIMCAVSLDGKIARGPKDPVDWTTKEDKKVFAQETKKAGVVIMGRQTFEAIGRPLKDRLNIVLTHRPRRSKSQRGILEFTNLTPARILKNLSRRGFKKVFVIGGGKVNSLFLKSNLVNELWLTLAPKVFGRGIDLFKAELGKDLRIISLTKFPQGYLFLKYKFLAR